MNIFLIFQLDRPIAFKTPINLLFSNMIISNEVTIFTHPTNNISIKIITTLKSCSLSQSKI